MVLFYSNWKREFEWNERKFYGRYKRNALFAIENSQDENFDDNDLQKDIDENTTI